MLDNISYKGRKPDNVRSQFNTIAEMVSFSEDYLPEIYITLNAATGKSGSFDITVGSNEYGFIAFPSSFGTLSSVEIGGFNTDVISCGTISFTNASGGTTNYNIYRTGRHSLGAITMEIK